VTTAVGGLPDLLDHGALGKLTPTGDASALATAILDTLLTPPDGTAAQRLMLDRYGINRLVRDLDSLYRGLLSKKKRLKN
jgi:glycosyltransferase involved in cell wall biosynthesis